MAFDPAYLSELFQAVGDVRCRRMFGGAGVFADGLMFALETGGVLYLKADASTESDFRAEGCEPFSYATASGRRVVMSYWRLPERLLDEPDDLVRWAKAALGVARAAKAGTPAKRRKTTGARAPSAAE